MLAGLQPPQGGDLKKRVHSALGVTPGAREGGGWFSVWEVAGAGFEVERRDQHGHCCRLRSPERASVRPDLRAESCAAEFPSVDCWEAQRSSGAPETHTVGVLCAGLLVALTVS